MSGHRSQLAPVMDMLALQHSATADTGRTTAMTTNEAQANVGEDPCYQPETHRVLEVLQLRGCLDVVARNIHRYLGLVDVLNLSKVHPKLAANHAEHKTALDRQLKDVYNGSTHNIDLCLGKYFDQPTEFRTKLRESRGFIFGQFVVDFFHHRPVDLEKSLVVVLDLKEPSDLRVWLSQRGYVSVRDIEIVRHIDGKDLRMPKNAGVLMYNSDDLRAWDEGDDTVRVRSIRITSDYDPLGWYYTHAVSETAQFAFMTATHACHPYWDMSVIDGKSIKNLGVDCYVNCACLQPRGILDKHFASTMRPHGELQAGMLGSRSVCDAQSVVIAFDTGDVSLPVGPAWKLHACAIEMEGEEYRAPWRSRGETRSRHKYTMSNRREFDPCEDRKKCPTCKCKTDRRARRRAMLNAARVSEGPDDLAGDERLASFQGF